MDLLDYYRSNLQYIRGLAAEFAVEFPKIAGRLSLSEFECQDPYIERLLEGTAFLSAQVEKKLDEGYYYFLESVLNSMTPHALYPIPSGGVLELMLNYNHEKVREGLMLEAGTRFDAAIPTINTPCRFSSLIPIPLVPFSLTGVEYITRDLSSFGINNPQGVSALHLICAAPGGNALAFLDELQFFINLPEAEASLLQRQIMQDTLGVYVRHNDGSFVPVTGISFDLPMSIDSSISHDLLSR
jgi:type VI secretion system protein ImpG